MRKRRNKKKDTGILLIAAGVVTLFGAMGAAVGWESLSEALGATVGGVVDFVGGGMQIFVIVGLLMLASGATVLALQRS